MLANIAQRAGNEFISQAVSHATQRAFDAFSSPVNWDADCQRGTVNIGGSEIPIMECWGYLKPNDRRQFGILAYKEGHIRDVLLKDGRRRGIGDTVLKFGLGFAAGTVFALLYRNLSRRGGRMEP